MEFQNICLTVFNKIDMGLAFSLITQPMTICNIWVGPISGLWVASQLLVVVTSDLADIYVLPKNKWSTIWKPLIIKLFRLKYSNILTHVSMFLTSLDIQFLPRGDNFRYRVVFGSIDSGRKFNQPKTDPKF